MTVVPGGRPGSVMEGGTTPRAGQVVGDRYELREVIGAGGMGVVWSAFDRRLQRPVAVKFLNPEATADRAAAGRFQREALAAGRIGHENICDVRDLGTTDDGIPFIVMELLEGAPLSDLLLSQGRLPPERAVEIIRQVLAALAAAHQAGIVHRDLKPENVFLARGSTGTERVKLVDFGISKILDDGNDLKLTATGMVVGSPFYMSPEQARGQRDVDGRSDIFSVGVLFFEMLTGQLPFAGENYNEVMINIVTKEPLRPRDLVPEIPPWVEKVVLRALSKDRARRYASAEEMAADLKEPSLPETVSTLPASGSGRGVVVGVVVAAVVVLLLAGIGGFILVGSGMGQVRSEGGHVEATSPAERTVSSAGEGSRSPQIGQTRPETPRQPPLHGETKTVPSRDGQVGGATSAEVASPAPARDEPGEADAGANPNAASPRAVMTLSGVPEGAAVFFDGTPVVGGRVAGAPGHRGVLTVVRRDGSIRTGSLVLRDGGTVDLSPLWAQDGGPGRQGASTEISDSARAASSVGADAGASQASRNRPSKRNFSGRRRPPRGRYIQRGGTKILVDYP